MIIKCSKAEHRRHLISKKREKHCYQRYRLLGFDTAQKWSESASSGGN